MSGERCNICGIFGTSTSKCCGNNKEVRIKQIKEEMKKLRKEFKILKEELEELNNE